MPNDMQTIPLRLATLFTMAVSIGAFGCADEQLKGDGDAGTDADIDSDADSDCDTDTGVFVFDPQRVYDDVAWLADDERGGRAPATEGNETALDYMEAYFSEIGLEPAGDDGTYRQFFMLDVWEITGDTDASFAGETLTYGSDFAVFPYSGSGDVSGDVVFAGHGMTVPPFSADEYPACPLDSSGYDDFEGMDVTGKIALVIRHGPGDDESIHDNCPASGECAAAPCLWSFGYKAKNAAAHGAVGMVLVNNYQQGPELPPSVTIGEDYYTADFPAIFAHRDLVEEAIPELPAWSDAIDADLVPHSQATDVTASLNISAAVVDVTVPNLLGAVPGADPDLADEVVVIGAHIDHVGTDPVTMEVYNGADDNASGAAVVTELARGMAYHDTPPARTVLFALWNAEEVGLVGSCYYVGNPTYAIVDTVAAYSVDMVGGGAGIGIVMFGGTADESSWLFDLMGTSAAGMDLDYHPYAEEPSYDSDHACFALVEIPAVMISTVGLHANYHTPQDDIDNITVEDLEAAVWLMWAGILPLAMGTEDQYLSKYIPPMARFEARAENVKHFLQSKM